ncbi:copine family protein [Rhynchospora pubera]|uniref:Copine family protein n=1 Tax=Rhynchospora pubera TaxID=906938 RepID=A0AAV8BX58_9POAL|nr:copine family protein [Rhynchospora pubera]
MGGSNSKSRRAHRSLSHGRYANEPSSHGRYANEPSSHGRYANYTNNIVPPPSTINRIQRKYSQIGDDFVTLEQVTDALAQAGLESSNLIVGIDFTKSNEWTGRNSFNRRCLHALGGTPNPYEQAISIIGRTLAKFDDDNLIPCFGFGDASTHDQEVFSFYADNRPCDGFEEALQRYRELVPNLRLAGPTSFAPIIETAIGIVDNSGGQYHVLLIIADGQVTRSVDMEPGQLSPQERDTINAIVKASDYPLSIVLVGVGDGPWDTMKQFDDNIPSRAFDNFQFVNFTEIMLRNIPGSKREAEFALAALMEIPSQYKATMDLQLLGKRKGIPERFYLPPPARCQNQTYDSPKLSQGSSYQSTSATDYKSNGASPSYGQSDDRQDCPICWAETKNLAFGCGHQTCTQCGNELKVCPICQRQITTRIRLY